SLALPTECPSVASWNISTAVRSRTPLPVAGSCDGEKRKRKSAWGRGKSAWGRRKSTGGCRVQSADYLGGRIRPAAHFVRTMVEAALARARHRIYAHGYLLPRARTCSSQRRHRQLSARPPGVRRSRAAAQSAVVPRCAKSFALLLGRPGSFSD